MIRNRTVARRWANRLMVAAALPVALCAVALASRASPDRGVRLARWAVKLLSRACGVWIEAEGALPEGAGDRVIVVANHSSPLDIAALVQYLPDARFVAAAELFRIPLLAAAMRGLDTVPIERRDPKTARRQLDSLFDALRGIHTFRIVLFPEGRIPAAGERAPFKSGAFDLAIRLQAPIQPVAIHGSASVLPPKGRLGVRPGTVRVQFLPLISPGDEASATVDTLREGAESSILAALASERRPNRSPSDPRYRRGPVSPGEPSTTAR